MLSRSARVEDLREHGATWVASPAEMLALMTEKQRRRFEQLCSEQAFLVARGAPSPRLDPALADASLEPRVAAALAVRNLMRRVLEDT